MNELVLANRAADWRRLKMLVLDSVSSPITKRVYNLGLDEFFEWFGRGPFGRRYTDHRKRLARRTRGPRAGLDFDQRAHHSRAQTGSRGGRQRVARAGVGR